MNWVDFVLLAILGAAAIAGWTRGIVRMGLSFLGFVLSIWVAARFASSAVQFLQSSIQAVDRAAAFLARYINLPAQAGQVGINDVPLASLVKILEATAFPEPFRSQMTGSLQRFLAAGQAADNPTLAEFFYRSLAGALLTAVAFLVLAWFVSLAAQILVRLLEGAMKDSPVGTLNQAGGAALGLAVSASGLSLLLGLLMPFIFVSSVGQTVTESAVAGVLFDLFDTISLWLFGPDGLLSFIRFPGGGPPG